MTAASNNVTRAIIFLLVAIGFATSQDAIVKGMSSAYPAYETVAMRGLAATPVLFLWAWFEGESLLNIPRAWKLVTLRSFILFTAYMAFVLAIATLPLANAVAIYFTMPFFVAALSGWFLGERVPAYRWATIILGFLGVVVSVRPGTETFQPASLLALYSALGYALGQMMSRKLSLGTGPLMIANIQSLFYLMGSMLMGGVILALDFHAGSFLTFTSLTKPLAWPTLVDFSVMCLMGLFSALSSVYFIKAYQAAPTNFVAPFEYSAMIWALAYGIIFFQDYPDGWTLIGAAIVVAAGLTMLWRDSRVKAQTIG
jgi:drug/metabolite transporter (DMT)-like permease